MKNNLRIVLFSLLMLTGAGTFAVSPQSTIDSLTMAAEKAKGKKLVDIYNQIAWSYRNIHADSTFSYGFKATDLAIKIEYNEGLSTGYNYMGIAMRNKSVYTEAMSLFYRALKTAEKSDNLTQISYSLINIGNIYLYQSNFDGAIQYFEHGLKNGKELKDARLMSYAYLNMGRAHLGLKEIPKSRQYLQKSLDLRKELNDIEGIAIIMVDMIEVLHAENKQDSALLTFDQNISRIKKLGHNNTLAYSYINIAKVLLDQGAYDKAMEYIKACLEISAGEELKNAEILAYNVQAQIYEKYEKPNEALDTYKMYLCKKDSLFNAQSARKIEALFSAYMNEKSEIEKKLLMDRMEFDETIIKRQRIIITLSVLVAILFLIVAAVAFRSSIERKRLSEQIQEQKDAAFKHNNDLIDINNEKNNLIRILSHDLRAPINNIKGLAQLYQMDRKDISQEENESLEMIKSESDRLLGMIKKILNVEALEDDKKLDELEPVDICKITREVAKSFSNAAQSKAIEIEVNVPENPLYVHGDEVHMYQIFENLTSNAIKFSEQDKKIDISIIKENGTIRTSVKDEGPGLTQEDENNLFKKFQTLSAKPTGNEETTGLGLSIVKKYTTEMNGRVWHESELGKGTTFHVEFDETKG